jgi:hypothetical protein
MRTKKIKTVLINTVTKEITSVPIIPRGRPLESASD